MNQRIEEFGEKKSYPIKNLNKLSSFQFQMTRFLILIIFDYQDRD